MRRIILLCSAILVVVAAITIILNVITTKSIYWAYETTGVRLNGSKSIYRATSFDSISVGDFWDWQSSDRFSLYWNHHPISFSGITTTTLKGIGFDIRQFYYVGAVDRAEYYSPIHGNSSITVNFRDSVLIGFSIQCKNGSNKRWPAGFSFDSKPELRLPLTEKQVLATFGPPDYVDVSLGQTPSRWKRVFLEIFAPDKITDP